MNDRTRAVQLNEDGMAANERGDLDAAARAYRAAIDADPDWSVPHYNLGLQHKYRGEWRESFECNRRAAELTPDDQASNWNLGIAATALGEWAVARRAWKACGIDTPAGDGPPDGDFGSTPVRLEPDVNGEVVWGRRLDPARVRIGNVPLPTSTHRWGDIVLIDGAPEGERQVNGRTYPVFNALARLVKSSHRTYVVELATADEAAIDALDEVATQLGGAAEDWGTTTRILCRECSYGLPHEHPDDDSRPAHPHCGVAARDEDHAGEIIERWLATAPGADLIRWYPAGAA